jgi:hypothetical protein
MRLQRSTDMQRAALLFLRIRGRTDFGEHDTGEAFNLLDLIDGSRLGLLRTY